MLDDSLASGRSNTDAMIRGIHPRRTVVQE